jgi:class 3 adenylate cyclase
LRRIRCDSRADRERKLATVLFADLAGSTDLADGEDPERTRALLDRFYDAMAMEIERAGGTVEKFVGDAVCRRRLRAGTTLGRRAPRLLPRPSDPDDRHFAQMRAVDLDLATGHIRVARERSVAFQEMVQGLTPHHRLHGMAARIDVETFSGGWDDVRVLAANAERAVDANRETPCTASVPTLLDCALASLRCGDNGEANRLEFLANAQRPEGGAWPYALADLRLAAARNDHPELERLLALHAPRLSPDVFDCVAAVLDALVALGDRERIESEAPRWTRPGTYLEPFALRALGFARDDEALLEQATARFEAMELDWHAVETRRLIS